MNVVIRYSIHGGEGREVFFLLAEQKLTDT